MFFNVDLCGEHKSRITKSKRCRCKKTGSAQVDIISVRDGRNKKGKQYMKERKRSRRQNHMLESQVKHIVSMKERDKWIYGTRFAIVSNPPITSTKTWNAPIFPCTVSFVMTCL